ncbi:MAG: tyrosine-type recombinase/integrase [Bdellovibrionales bacterium]|nr:tyrosine-type recombinase/integrase [Bdellovibrionales bacterium]
MKRSDSVLPATLVVASPGEDPTALGSPRALAAERFKDVIESYLRYYAAGEGHTARAKRYDLNYFLEFLAAAYGAPELVPVSAWTMQSTKDFVDHRLSLGEAPATVGRRLATIKHLGRTLAERVSGYINPAREVKTPTIQPTRPRGLEPEEIALLRRAADARTQQKKYAFLAVRNRFLLELLLSTGLRADEVRLLYLWQISEDRCWLKNVKTKGRKFRNVYLDTSIRQLLNAYLDQREKELQRKYPSYRDLSAKERGRYPVFVSLYTARLGEPSSFGLAPKSVWRIISDFGRTARALGDHRFTNLHPHKLRHTFAHGLLDTSRDVRLVAQALGHSDVRTTMRYTERTDEQVALAIEEKVSKGR